MPIRAVRMTGPNEPLEVITLPDPEPGPGEVVLDTIASEVCGTDVHLWKGRLEVPWPIIPGHVSVGRIAQVGPRSSPLMDATGVPVRTGDIVTFLDVHGTCHACYHCAIAGQPNRCPSRRVYGITESVSETPLGGWSEQILLREDVHILKLDADPDRFIGGGCGLFTGFAAVERSGMRMGDSVLIQGAGPVGLAAAAFAHLRGAGRIVMIGAPEARLRLAAAFGVDRTVGLNLAPEERRTAVMDGGRGMDVVIEATGNPEALPEGLELMRDGGTYVVAGHYTDAGPIPLNPHVLNRKHVDLRGQWGTDLRHLVGALRMLERHGDALPFERVIGARYPLERAGEALRAVDALDVTKAIIDPRPS